MADVPDQILKTRFFQQFAKRLLCKGQESSKPKPFGIQPVQFACCRCGIQVSLLTRLRADASAKDKSGAHCHCRIEGMTRERQCGLGARKGKAGSRIFSGSTWPILPSAV